MRLLTYCRRHYYTQVRVMLGDGEDKKAKDTVTYHSWQWDMSMFCHSGWDDHNMQPYASGLYKDSQETW